MKFCVLLCLALWVCIPAFGQEKYYGSIKRPSKDTPILVKTMWKQFSDELLPSINAFKAKEYLRLTNEKQVLDLWEIKDDSVGGMIVSWVNEYVRSNEEQTNRSFTVAKFLQTTVATHLLKFVDSAKLVAISSNYPLPDSVIMNDGFIYNLVFAKEGNLISKQHIQSDGRYVERNGADTLIEKIFALANGSKPFYGLGGDPFECSSQRGNPVGCKPYIVKTSKWFYNETRQVNRQKKAYAQERKNYLKKFLKKDPAIFFP